MIYSNASVTYNVRQYSITPNYGNNVSVSYQMHFYAKPAKINYDFFNTTEAYNTPKESQHANISLDMKLVP